MTRIDVLKWSPETAAHVIKRPFKTIYNWLIASLLKQAMADLPDKSIRQKRRYNGKRQMFVQWSFYWIETKNVQLRQDFGHFEVDMMQSSKKRGDILVTITERLIRHNILSVMLVDPIVKHWHQP